ncbi:membrane protein [Staphylococcus aureus]|nr:membrane protein [Staphylococcus aureus]
MSKKHVFIIIGVILCICTVSTVMNFKMKYDEKEKQKAIYYKEQQERITLYLKHNTKETNTIKSVHFTNLETSPMGSAVIEGYINENKEDDFTAYASPEHNYQFGGAMIKSEGVDKLLKPAHERKSPEKIKEELDKKEGH